MVENTPINVEGRFRHGLTHMITFCVLIFVVLGCGMSDIEEPKKLPSEFFGNWKGEDASSMTIRGDGTGDYTSGEIKIKDADFEYYEKEKSIEIVSSIFSDKTFSIEDVPEDDRMKLSGVSYRKVKDFTERTSEEMPSEEESIKLAKESFDEVLKALKNDDFTDFYNVISELWRRQTKPKELRNELKYSSKEIRKLLILLSQKPILTETPSFTRNKEVKILALEGKYETEPITIFKFEYVFEGGEWKLVSFSINAKK